MRITGGEARGRVIAGPEGLTLRPTGSKVRQAFFNILGNKLYGCSFLDICAGSGLIGIEALSRGAGSL
ncbi:MAG: RsmD family RNA methyltransferase, partial [Candidatus Obscuribacterales bacterium]|nr:RsmD family RNA methyltransferase [Candidatus Obscuribacterales bacterium]